MKQAKSAPVSTKWPRHWNGWLVLGCIALFEAAFELMEQDEVVICLRNSSGPSETDQKLLLRAWNVCLFSNKFLSDNTLYYWIVKTAFWHKMVHVEVSKNKWIFVWHKFSGDLKKFQLVNWSKSICLVPRVPISSTLAVFSQSRF